MTTEYQISCLAGYTEREQEMNRRLNELFEEWYACVKAGAEGPFKGRFDPAWFVTDGFYPRYTEQKPKILFIGREAHGIGGGSYIDVLHKCYRTNYIGERHINKYQFHYRQFYIAYGLTNHYPSFEALPQASELTPNFATPGGLSFAFMNFSKLSNETANPTRLNRPIVESFLECSRASGENFFNREIAIIEPDLIIAARLFPEWLDSGCLGELKKMPPVNEYVNCYLLKVKDQEIPLLNPFHFSAIKKDKEHFYDPIVESLRTF